MDYLGRIYVGRGSAQPWYTWQGFAVTWFIHALCVRHACCICTFTCKLPSLHVIILETVPYTYLHDRGPFKTWMYTISFEKVVHRAV